MREQTSLSEIEAAYCRDFARFLHVATAITGDVELAADSVQDAFARAIRLRYDAGGAQVASVDLENLLARPGPG